MEMELLAWDAMRGGYRASDAGGLQGGDMCGGYRASEVMSENIPFWQVNGEMHTRRGTDTR